MLQDIIREAKDAIERKKGASFRTVCFGSQAAAVLHAGDAAILSANIESNQLTTEVAASYIEVRDCAGNPMEVEPPFPVPHCRSV